MGISSGSGVRIRLARGGHKHRPFYRIVVTKRRSARDGKPYEVLGTYDPIPDRDGNKQLTLNVERMKVWICRGAEPSERVAKILGIAEVLPPAPRRYIAKAVVDGMSAASVADAIGLDGLALDSAEAEGSDAGADRAGVAEEPQKAA